MADQSTSKSGMRRSAVYSYLRPIISGRRVLEIGCGTGEGAAYLARLGAKNVTGAGRASEVTAVRGKYRGDGALGFISLDGAGLATSGSFDLIIVPDATDILRGRGPVPLSALLDRLLPGAYLACMVPNGDRGEGLAYYDVVDALAPNFAKVRMFGQSPFVAYGIAEFDEAAVDLRVDSDLALRDGDEPTHYLALCGPDTPVALGYALVQIPTADICLDMDLSPAHAPAHAPAHVGAGGKIPEAAAAELRQKLTESEGKAEGLLRVSRAQSEEIEELRARLRRTAEARTELDEEVRRLRRALIEADESVVNLTRKTTEEMTTLAQRLTSGLRGESVPSPVLAEELRKREEALAALESALSERDDRIAALEVAKQDAIWRADAAEDELGKVRAELVNLRTEYERALAQARAQGDASEARKAQEASIEEYRRAAAAHVDEVNRLRDAANEQASLVAELEEALVASEKRLTEVGAEAAQLRKTVVEVEEADRVRRSRLAELEGRMLRAEHASAKASEVRQRELAELQELRARLANATSDEERARLGETEKALAEAQASHQADLARLVELEAQVRANQEREQRLAELRVEAPDPEEVYERLFDLETQYQAATMAAARVPSLEARVAELEARLSSANHG